MHSRVRRRKMFFWYVVGLRRIAWTRCKVKHRMAATPWYICAWGERSRRRGWRGRWSIEVTLEKGVYNCRNKGNKE